jgi:hypothetical protein
MSSDGTVAKSHQAAYFEKNRDRREYVKRLFLRVGAMDMPSTYSESGRANGFRMPSVIWRILVCCGFPVGDRAIQGYKIPDFILDGPIELLKAYLEEVIPEDGWVTFEKKRDLARIGIGRAAVIYDPKKNLFGKYDGKLFVTLIRRYGKKKKKFRSKQENYTDLALRRLEELTESDDSEISQIAAELEKTVHQSFPQHLIDEEKIFEKLGIDVEEFIATIAY